MILFFQIILKVIESFLGPSPVSGSGQDHAHDAGGIRVLFMPIEGDRWGGHCWGPQNSL